MALVMMADEVQSASAIEELTGKSVDVDGNIVQSPESKDRQLLIEPAKREVMTCDEKEERSQRAKELQAENVRITQKRVDATVLAKRKALMEQSKVLRATIPEDERDKLITRHKFEKASRKFGKEPRQLCSSCWLMNFQCICAKTPAAVLEAYPHRTLVYLHVKEYGRQSNTGALIASAFPPPQSGVYVAGVAEHEALFQQELSKDPTRTMLLFPSADSLSVDEFLQLARERPPLAGQGHDGPAEPSTAATVMPVGATTAAAAAATSPGRSADGGEVLTVVLVDGTWQQARKLALKVPGNIKRVRLEARELTESLYHSPMRCQATPDRVCSLSAFALLVRQLLRPRLPSALTPSLAGELPAAVAADAPGADAGLATASAGGGGEVVAEYLMGLLRRKAEVVLGNTNKEWKHTQGRHGPASRTATSSESEASFSPHSSPRTAPTPPSEVGV